MGSALRGGLATLVLLIAGGCAEGGSTPDGGDCCRDAGPRDASSPDPARRDGGPDAGAVDAAPPGPRADGGPDAGPECTSHVECASRLCEDGACAPPPEDCRQVLARHPSATTSLYTIDPNGGGGFEVLCDMDFDGGGWTLVGTVANDGTRRWNDLVVFVGDGTFGDVATPTGDLKSAAWATVAGTDLLVRTDEYAVGWAALLDGASLASWLSARYDAAACSTSFLGGRPSWAEGLTAEQIDVFDVVVRALDDNSSCFPAGNENALLTLTLQDCCWTNGLGNTPVGHDVWQTHDLSLLRAGNLVRGSCTAGTYPCNPRGYWNAGTPCYDTSCKVAWAQVYVR